MCHIYGYVQPHQDVNCLTTIHLPIHVIVTIKLSTESLKEYLTYISEIE